MSEALNEVSSTPHITFSTSKKAPQLPLKILFPSLLPTASKSPLLNTKLQQPTDFQNEEILSIPSPSKQDVPSVEFKKCKLCWEDISSDCMFKLSSCKCSFCSKCLKEYLVLNIQDGNVRSVECPDHECPMHGSFTSSEIQMLVSNELFKKYKKLKLQNEIDLNPFQSFCPSKHCDTIVTLPRQEFDKHKQFTSRPAICSRCGFQFCVLCKEAWHEGQSCAENLKHLQTMDNFDGIKYDESEDAQIKRCPFCFLPIERDGGCAQVKCKKCNHIFCWFCLACLDRDALFFHFERGPCKNKLGHSRASIIWHRMQVLTIFAGVGLLVLLASPFLLLAAPCVVCCKFRAFRDQSKRKRNNETRIVTSDYHKDVILSKADSMVAINDANIVSEGGGRYVEIVVDEEA